LAFREVDSPILYNKKRNVDNVLEESAVLSLGDANFVSVLELRGRNGLLPFSDREIMGFFMSVLEFRSGNGFLPFSNRRIVDAFVRFLEVQGRIGCFARSNPKIMGVFV
jgi:hypothetical protein